MPFQSHMYAGSMAGAAPPTLELEAVNTNLPTSDRITNTVDSTPRQSWWGFGWGLGVPSSDIRQEAAQWADRLFDELGTKVLRFNGPDDALQPTLGKETVDVGVDNGVDTVIATGYWARRRYTEVNEPPGGTATYTPTNLANDIDALMDLGMLITHACLQNEPDGAPQGLPKNALVEPSTGVPYDMRAKYNEFRTALNARSRNNVHIIGCEWAHFNNPGMGEYDTLNAAPTMIPSILGYGAGHCYHDCPTNNDYDSRWMTKAAPTGGLPLATNGMWSTETGSMGMPHWGARCIAGLNHGTVVEVAHIGVANNSDGGGQTLIHSNGTRHPEHGQARVIFGKQPNGDITIPRGARFRLVHSSDWPLGTAMDSARLSQTAADRMIRDGGVRMPRINSACCKRTDGRWTFVACNTTFDPEVVNSFIDARYEGATIQITVTITELVTAGATMTWSAHRAAPVTGALSPQTVNMVNGVIRFTLAAGETIGMISSGGALLAQTWSDGTNWSDTTGWTD